MPHGDALFYVRRASRSQINTCLAIAVALLVAFVATVPFAHRELPRYGAFIPVVDALLLFGDAVTATILLVQSAVLKSRALLALALGYAFAALIIIPHALTFPDAFAASGLLGAGLDTTAWLYVIWHCSLPVAVIAYATLRRSPAEQRVPRSMKRLIVGGLAAVVIAALLLTLLATVGHELLPPIMVDATAWRVVNLLIVAGSVVVLLIIAMAMVWRGERSLLDIWLLVALLAWMIDALLLMASSERYSLGWYSGRIAGLLAGIFVVLALLIETSRLYMQLALSAAAERRRREGQLLSLDAAAAAIAHEVKQPVAAMTTNAAAALIRLRHAEPDKARIEQSLQAIVDDGHRAAEVVGSIRALFGARTLETEPVDLNALVRESLELLSVALAGRRVAVELDLASELPALKLQGRQIQQVMLNLVTNAIEAVDETASPRRVSVATQFMEGAVEITVSDTGAGIPQDRLERIFDAFFTTKSYGTGMGLPLCRSIVEAHGGSIWAATGPGGGAQIRVRLPVPSA